MITIQINNIYCLAKLKKHKLNVVYLNSFSTAVCRELKQIIWHSSLASTGQGNIPLISLN